MLCTLHSTSQTPLSAYTAQNPTDGTVEEIWVFWDESRSRTCRTSSFCPISSTDGLLIHCQEARMHHRSEYVENNRATEEARLARSRDPIMSKSSPVSWCYVDNYCSPGCDHGRPHIGANGVGWPPGKMDEKLKSKNMQKEQFSMFMLYFESNQGRQV